jgi:nicotinamidase-related amidase
MRIIRDQTTALIIDIQERLFPHIHDHDALASRTGILIRGLQVLKVPVHVTQQYSRGLGQTIAPIGGLFNPFSHIEKTAFSCCDEPKVILMLEATGRKNVLLAGIESHVCVQQTVIDLLERGYQPVVIEDCVSSRRPYDNDIAVQRMRREGAVISTCESILFELCRYSGTEEFKSISALVK